MQQFSIADDNKLFFGKFRNYLRECQYTHDQFLQFGINPFAYDQYDLPLFAYRHKALTSFNILFHLFFLGRRVKIDNIRKIFDQNDINELFKIKIFERIDSSYIQSSVLILPYKNYYFACDFVLQLDDRFMKRPKNYELVYPVNLDSITLSETSFKRNVNTLLDLCCGSGIIGIVASTHSKKVVGIDINPRAVNFSTFNALFNNISNCYFKCGDLFDPIKEDKFDLILSNPPYEISLNKTNLFQDGGQDGFKILKRIISGIPDHLTKNGYCQIITKFAVFQKESIQQTLKKWFLDKKVHIFFLKLYTMGVEQTASSICADTIVNKGKINYKEFSNNIDKIMTHFDRMHFTNISFGVITIKRATCFKYNEQIFNSSNILATELSNKLQYAIYKHFVFSLGSSSVSYFLGCFLHNIVKRYFPLLNSIRWKKGS